MAKITIVDSIITGVCNIISSIIAGKYQTKSNKEKKRNNGITNKSKRYINIPNPKHPALLNPDEYDIEDENYFVTLAGLFQQSRDPKDVTIKKIDKEE